MRLAAPSGVSAGLARSTAIWASSQRFPTRPPEKTDTGRIMPVIILPMADLQKHSLQASFWSGVRQSLLHRLPAPAAAAGAPAAAGAAAAGPAAAAPGAAMGGTWAPSRAVRPAASATA